MHTHLSLWRDEQNAFIGERPYGLSDVATKFIAGLVRHAPEITAVTNQWVNSYKRLVPGAEAPVGVEWARYDAAALVRVPSVKPGRIDSTRVEYRSPDPAANPYLAFAVILAAGLRGVAGDYELPPEGERVAALPQSLAEAVDLMEASIADARDPRQPPGRVVPAQQARRVGRLPRAGDALRARALPATAVIDVVLCVPSCEGPVRKAFDVTGVTPAVAASARLNEVAALEPADGFCRCGHQRGRVALHRGHEPLSPASPARARRRTDHPAARPLPARRPDVSRGPLRRLRRRPLRRAASSPRDCVTACAARATRASRRASSTASCR